MRVLLEDLFGINRSLTGPGVVQTLERIRREIPIEIKSVPTGTQCFDWTVPDVWEFESARLYDQDGALLFDAHNCPLHVMGYSDKFSGWLYREELYQYLIVGPEELPDAIPYATSYYEKRPGFCVSWNQAKSLNREAYMLSIRTEFKRGEMHYADAVIPGEGGNEIMLTSYTCHPGSLANNETSGLVVLTELVKWWQSEPRRHSLRVLLAPETIGAISYLDGPAPNSDYPRMFSYLRVMCSAGFVLTCLGGPGQFALQLGREENYASRIARNALVHLYDSEIRPWGRRGSDERQFTAPGVDLAFCTVMKTPPGHYRYPQYHTSADDLSYVTVEQLEESVEAMKLILSCIEDDRPYRSNVLGEPMLSKRNLMPSLSCVGSSDGVRSLMTTWSYCDGRTLLANAEAQRRPMWDVRKEIDVLLEHGIAEAL